MSVLFVVVLLWVFWLFFFVCFFLGGGSLGEGECIGACIIFMSNRSTVGHKMHHINAVVLIYNI